MIFMADYIMRGLGRGHNNVLYFDAGYLASRLRIFVLLLSFVKSYIYTIREG